jgi:hypothetical protein
MSWYKITLPFAEAGIGGKAKELQTAFETLFKANHAPKNAAMFTSRDESFENCSYYFSPGTIAFAEALIRAYSGVTCEPPLAEEVNLLVGHDGAAQTLLPKKESG